jgi:hypothetical protein
MAAIARDNYNENGPCEGVSTSALSSRNYSCIGQDATIEISAPYYMYWCS